MKMLKLENKANPWPTSYARSMRLTVGKLDDPVKLPAIGIDPGVNFGLTVLRHRDVYVFHGALVKETEPGCYGVAAYYLLDHMTALLAILDASVHIEGAAYGATFRQVELSEIRTGFYLAAHKSFDHVKITPPSTIRKSVFGSGKTQAMDQWPVLNHNAADSLAIALYAAGLQA